MLFGSSRVKEKYPFVFFFLANSVDPDQMPHFVASDLGLHCLPSFCLWVPRY